MMKKATQFVLLLLAIISTVIAGRVAYLLWNESSLEMVLAHSRATGTEASVEQTPEPVQANNTSPAAENTKSNTIASYSPPTPLPALPDEITTADNVTYKGVVLQKAEADGLSIQYTPSGGGIGLAKLAYENLPAELQSAFGYDLEKALVFREAKARDSARLAASMWADHKDANKRTAIRLAREDAEARAEEKRAQEFARKSAEEERRRKTEEERIRQQAELIALAGKAPSPSPIYNINMMQPNKPASPILYDTIRFPYGSSMTFGTDGSLLNTFQWPNGNSTSIKLQK